MGASFAETLCGQRVGAGELSLSELKDAKFDGGGAGKWKSLRGVLSVWFVLHVLIILLSHLGQV